jgi:hypothetical protein
MLDEQRLAQGLFWKESTMRKALYSLCAMLGMVAATLGSVPAHASLDLALPVPPPSDKIVIDVVTVNGSGCPAGTASVAMSLDNTAFTVIYSNYMALVGIGATSTDFRKNCQINLIVHIPSGFVFAITSVEYRGYASLAAGASATERANYYFQGDTAGVYTTHTLAGGYENDWLTNDEVPIASLVWSPCGVQRNLNINSELRVAAGTSDTKTTTSFISMDSTDGEINVIYHFSWATC